MPNVALAAADALSSGGVMWLQLAILEARTITARGSRGGLDDGDGGGDWRVLPSSSLLELEDVSLIIFGACASAVL